MRTSETVFHQIRWDPRLDPERFVVGIDVHQPEPKRMSLAHFDPDGDIPWHRVLFIELDGTVAWDRAGVDDLDAIAEDGRARPRPLGQPWSSREAVRFVDGAWGPYAGGKSASDRLRVVTWNVLWDKYDAELVHWETRWPRLVAELLEEAPDLIALQEVTPAFHALLMEHPLVRAHYWVSHRPGHPDVGDYDLLFLGRTAIDQVAIWPMGHHKALLGVAFDGIIAVTTHLTSDHSANSDRTRAGQLRSLRAALALHPRSLCLADFNMKAEESFVDGEDVWLALHPPVPTFDPPTNPLARLASLTGVAVRIDRIYARGLYALEARLIGTTATDGLFPSDHFGVLAEVSRTPASAVCEEEPTIRTALAWIPDDTAGIQGVRAEHDTGFDRWPPHVNVLWGFVDEASFDAAAAVLSTVEGAAFDTRLQTTERFAQAGSATHGLVPDEAHPWVQLHKRLRTAFPRCVPKRVFRPHLTFARTTRRAPTPPAPPVEGRVGSLALLSRRGSGPMAMRGVWELGADVHWMPEPPWPLGDPTPWDGAAGVLVGSRALGVALDGADVDLVFPEHDLGGVIAALEPHVEHWVEVEKGGLTGVRAWVGTHVIDALPRSERAHGAIAEVRAVLDRVGDRVGPWRQLCRHVKGWARAQSLDDAAWGGLEGAGWAVATAEVIVEADDLGLRPLLERFFARWATEGLSLTTLGEPRRPLGERAVPRLQDCLMEAWEALLDGAEPEDLLRPLPFHRRFRWCLRVRGDDPAAFGRIRGRARALLEATGGVPYPGRPHLLGIAPELFEAAQRWAGDLDGVSVAISRSDETGSELEPDGQSPHDL